MKKTGYIRKKDIEELKRNQELFKKRIKGKVSAKMQKRIDECGSFLEISSDKKKQ